MSDQRLAEEGAAAEGALGSSGSGPYFTVASDGTGDYSSIQAAIDALPDNSTGGVGGSNGDGCSLLIQ